jgi:hypothetical protein
MALIFWNTHLVAIVFEANLAAQQIEVQNVLGFQDDFHVLAIAIGEQSLLLCFLLEL